MNKVRDSKNVIFDVEKQTVSLFGVELKDGSRFRIPYRTTSLYFLNNDGKWQFVDKVTARKLYKYLKEVDKDQTHDYYELKISPFIKIHIRQ
jgi:hypothetical protein